MKNIRLHYSPQDQSGATLIIALIILVIMSLISISNMQSSTMQERMAANNRQKTIARQAAESAMREAEDWIAANVFQTGHLQQFDGKNSLYSEVDVQPGLAASSLNATLKDNYGAALLEDPDTWKNIGKQTITGKQLAEHGLSKSPRYVIEYLGRDKGGAGVTVTEMGGYDQELNTNPHIFRITAIGWGKDENIYALTQSTFRTGYGAGAGYFVY